MQAVDIESVKIMLDELYRLKEYFILLQKEWVEKRNLILPTDIQQLLVALDTERSKNSKEFLEEFDKRKAEIRDRIFNLGRSVIGEELIAEYSLVSYWDYDKLSEYLSEHPDVIQCRVVGEPNISIHRNETTT